MGVTVFSPAPWRADEFRRQQAVRRSGLLARQNDPRLFGLVKAAKAELAADWAAVVVIADDWQHVIASTGGHLGPHRRSACMSSFAILNPAEVFCVLDTARDPAFAESSYVDGGLIAFYAAAAIVDEAGLPLGVLCLTNRRSRAAFTADQRARLAAYAQMVEIDGTQGVPEARAAG